MTVKLGIYLAIIVALLGGIKWAHSSAYKSGWNAAVVEQEKLIREVKDQAVEDAEIKWKGLVDAAEGQIIVEEKIVEKVRIVNRDIETVVEKIVEVKPDCADLGVDFVKLFNGQVRAGRGNEVAGAGVTTDTNP